MTEVCNERSYTVLQLYTFVAWREATLSLASFKALAVESYGKLSTNINGLHIANILRKHNELETFGVVRVLLWVCILTVMFMYSYSYVCSFLCILFHCVVLCIACVLMCTGLLLPGANPITVNKHIIISYHTKIIKNYRVFIFGNPLSIHIQAIYILKFMFNLSTLFVVPSVIFKAC